ncbi:MAG TPA: hypothetical protein VFX29_05435 [Longimicrobiaceae bacterium]|jgi:PBP1b-binding outer membrane lipoprotein LpoB|nr:hypothetical protein [Longimicrobiaceae bacterium]
MRFARPWLFLFALLLVGCAHASGGESSRSRANTLTREELRAGNFDNLDHAIRTLRPNWVRERPPSDYLGERPEHAQVFVDGAHRGDVTSLTAIQVDDVESVRYLRATEAASLLGMQADASPAIVVTTKRGP